MDTTAQPEQPPVQAAEVEDETVCRFPGCTEPREPKVPGRPGGAPKYCADPDHNPMTALRARKKATPTKAVPVPEGLRDRPVAAAEHVARSLRQEVVDAVDNAVARLGDFVTELRTMTDPEAAAAQTYTVTTQAAAEIAQAQQTAADATAQLLTIQAENRSLLRTTEEAGEAAELAVSTLERRTEEFAQARRELEERTAAEVEAAKTEAAEQVLEVKREANRQVREAEADRDRQVAEANRQLEQFKVDTAAAREKETAAARQLVADAEADRDRQVEAAGAKQREAEERARTAEKRAVDAETAKTKADQQALAAEMEATKAKGRAEGLDEALAAVKDALEDAKQTAARGAAAALRHEQRANSLQDQLDAMREAKAQAEELVAKLQREIEQLRERPAQG